MDAISHILLAEQSRSDIFREGFRNRGATGRDDVLLGLLIVATLIAGMWAISRLVSVRRRRRGFNNPWQLFWALCKAHHLNWSESWLLRRLAIAQGLRDPGRLFLEVQCWEESSLGPRFALEYHRLSALREQIFAGEPPRTVPEAVIRPARLTRPPAPSLPPLFPGLPSPTLDVPPWTVET